MPVEKKKEEKVLSTEQVNQCMERLYARALEDKRRNDEKRKATLAQVPGRLPAKKISGSEVESLTVRMYEKQMEHQKLNREKYEKMKEKEVSQQQPKKTLTEEELNDSVARMYTQQSEIRKKNLEKLERKYVPQTESKKLTKDEAKAVGDRLATGFKEKKEEARKKIFDRDYAPMEPMRHTITPEEVKAMGDRLCTTRAGSPKN